MNRILKVMEICGTHTQTAVSGGLRSLLPPDVRLVSGPGCPVCVTPAGVIDALVEMSKNVAIVTFGDLSRVRGTAQSLSDAKAAGGDVRIVYSPFETLKLARENPEKVFVFAAIGFETTAPVYAALLEQTIEQGLQNLKICAALKTMPAAIEYICNLDDTPDGFIAPGHVCAVVGYKPFQNLAERFNKPFAVAGFTVKQMLKAAEFAAQNVGIGAFLNIYKGVVTENGQEEAKRLISKYFEPCGAYWRGIGYIENSGLKLRERFTKYEKKVSENLGTEVYKTSCRCKDVMLGRIIPPECPLFGNVCTPKTPDGACMVTSEGACGVWFRGGEGGIC